ncbi:GFP-like fluorescent chromoprotein FP506 [Montipora foliosa]|uniref:GFP-like fluorescent chromoprotein FP506 n=1 Tax=Montipora foliosa TaxID=591990 RepID=UPI0035F1C51F
MALSKQGVKDQMNLKFHMEGSVNGHDFTIKGEGTGHPYKGTQCIQLHVETGGPLPFSVDILSAVFLYGNRCITKYPGSIVDYFKNSCPAGYTWERSFLFEDGAVCTASADIRLSVEDNCFYHVSKFVGVNFPADGPVMTKATTGWEPSSEKMVPSVGILNGDVTMYLLLKGDKRHRCQFRSTYKAKTEPKEMPDFHFVEHKIVRTDLGGRDQKWQLVGSASACGSSL